ncbi:PREDICTED: uncharacterized protein LOC104820809 isoform X2 [Tarenaya hassleriana]|uniref:uncharacterized protein LOC104820809 isoform X1 n=1 Tax=Tarenaya hassleriana TaxID=28532 RepID=UPI00053CA339|nr:PREDICTED: uncharacterized protein LOC104820809 isoform X1 [Tarenaya hassleriana]XP_019058934.1 PREDICTED: uncharacterized protein LOC104820809 isoform X2 [Tarenaya hassleriana]
MIRDRSDIGFQIRRLVVISIRLSYRWVCSHPFLLGFVSFLVLLNRTCPVLFSLLVSASPVLVCTAVLLGTILSFGQQNIPEIENDPELVHEASLFKTELARDATVVEREDKSFAVERFVNKEKDGNDDGDGIEEDSNSVEYRPLVDETLNQKNQVKFKVEPLEAESEKTVEERPVEDDGNMSENTKDEQMDASPVSPWTPMRHDKDDDDAAADGDDSSDSGSDDGSESSSPDASMTDIIPMLDELHPLLHSEAANPSNISREGSDTASEGPHRSSCDEGLESDIDSDNNGGDEDGDNENEEDEEEEETKEEKEEEDESKSVIKWTEDDQKNVMDLGSLELERNQRLESLIARRRARQGTKLMAEKNLIDLDSFDVPFNMPPISTSRRNPFDLPYDSYDDMGLPPIPGSAPSVLVPRRNPFDIPYDPNEEKPDLKRDSFQEEFSPFHPKEPVFRRHESFSVGPSMLGGPRQDRSERLRPFFVLEKLAHERTSYYGFERQLSEVSESKVSSVPDTESLSTGLEEDDKKVHEHEADRGIEMPRVDPASDHDDEKSHSSEDVDFSEQADSQNLHNDVAEITLGDRGSHQEEQSNTIEGETSDKIETDEEDHSDSGSSLSGEEEKITDVKERESAASMSLEQRVDIEEESGFPAEPSFGESEIHLTRVDDDEHRHKIPAEGSFITAQPSLEESELHSLCSLADDHHHREPVYDSSPPSASRFPSFSSVSSDNQVEIPKQSEEQTGESMDKEPEVYSECSDQKLYDLEEEVHSTSAVNASDETESRTGQAVETTSKHTVGEVSLSAVETGIGCQNDPMGSSPVFEDAPVNPSSLSSDKDDDDAVDHREDNATLSDSSQEDREETHEDVKETADTRISDNSVSSGDLASPTAEEALREVEHLSTHQTCSLLDTGETREHSKTPEDTLDVLQDKAETSVAEGTTTKEEEEDPKLKGQASVTFDADIPIDSYSTLSSGAVEYVETHSFNEEDVPQSEQDKGQSSNSDTKADSYLNQTMDIEVDSVNASNQNVPSEGTSPSESDRELTWSDKSVVEQSTLEHREHQQPTRTGPVTVVFSRNITFHEYHDAEEDTTELSCLTSDSSSPPPESPEYKTPMVGEGSGAEFFHDTTAVNEELDHVLEPLHQPLELHETSQSPPEVINEEADEIKEIDDGLLSNLNTVGDFGVKEVVTNSEPGPSTREPDTAAERTETLPVLEARSVQDIQSAFQQIHEGSEVEEVILPSTIQDQLALETSGNSGEMKSELEVVDASSMEDLDKAMKRALEENTIEQPESPKSEDGSAERVEALPVLEARSVEDLQSAFQQIHEGSEVEEVILPSTIQDQLALETSENSGSMKSELEVVEAKSMEDLDKAVKKALEEDMDEQIKLPESEDGSAEVNGAIETKSSESSVEERSVDTTNDPLNDAPEEEKEAAEHEVMKSLDVSIVEVRSLEELPRPSESKDRTDAEEKKSSNSNVPFFEASTLEEVPEPSEPKERITTEVTSERALPAVGTDSSDVTASIAEERSNLVTEEAKAETVTVVEATALSPKPKETSENSGESISEGKKKKKKKSESDSSSSSSSSSDSD